jgi:hypothetical protein
MLENLVSRLPVKVQPYAKALVPLAAGFLVAGTDLSISGEEGRALCEVAGATVTSLLVLLVPNQN